MTSSLSNNETSSTVTVTKIEATHEMCLHCFDVLIHELLEEEACNNNKSSSSKSRTGTHQNYNNDIRLGSQQLQETLSRHNHHCPLFITWEKQRRRQNNNNNNCNNLEVAYDLRGCIGSLNARPLQPSTLSDFTISSAFRDQRFVPIDSKEVEKLRVSVSLLVDYEECCKWDDWEIGIHGIVIEFTMEDTSSSSVASWMRSHRFNNKNNPSTTYSATFLPEVASQQGWNHSITLKHLVGKAGYDGAVDEEFLQRIKVTRYKSSKKVLTFQEYLSMKNVPV